MYIEMTLLYFKYIHNPNKKCSVIYGLRQEVLIPNIKKMGKDSHTTDKHTDVATLRLILLRRCGGLFGRHNAVTEIFCLMFVFTF